MEKDNLFVVLNRPEGNYNIGAVARAMKNFDFTNLVLVNPYRFSLDEALKTACWAEDILHKASHVATLDRALTFANRAICFSARTGKNRPPVIDLPFWLEGLQSDSSPQDNFSLNEKIALVFGSESSGLSSMETLLCEKVVRIPASDKQPSFNLAQAVLLVLHELSKVDATKERRLKEESAVSQNQFEPLKTIILELAKKAHFDRDTTSKEVPLVLTNLFLRTQMSERELSILTGFFSRLLKHSKKKVL